MITTTFQEITSDEVERPQRDRLTTRSLRGDEIRAIADITYRGDNPLRFECVRQAALMFERAGYSITLSPDVSPLALPPEPIVIGNLVVDAMRRAVRLGRRELDLKPREFGLLEILARHPGQVFSRAHLLDCVWPRDYDGDERTVDVHIARLRHRLGANLIQTVHGVGYKLAAPGASFGA
jgi:DNA-binding response OmpR family regulator